MIWIIIGSVLLVIVCVLVGAARFAYKKVFYSPITGQNNEFNEVKDLDYKGAKEKARALTEVMLKIPYEDLEITSYDKLKLHAYFYRSEGSNEYVIFFHGYRRTARRSFSGLTMDLLKAKKNVILVDQRAHGESEGHTTTFGKKEQYDVVAWVNYVKQKFGDDVKITISGVSMGATAILFAADKIDEKVKIIADSPYISIKEVVISTIKKLKMKPVLIYPIMALASLLFCHMTLKYDARKTIANSKNKILIIHGEKDTVVPYQMNEEVCLNNNDHAKFALFPEVGHGLPYLNETEKYLKIFFEFMEN